MFFIKVFILLFIFLGSLQAGKIIAKNIYKKAIIEMFKK